MRHRNFATKIHACRVPDSNVAALEAASMFSHSLDPTRTLGAVWRWVIWHLRCRTSQNRSRLSKRRPPADCTRSITHKEIVAAQGNHVIEVERSAHSPSDKSRVGVIRTRSAREANTASGSLRPHRSARSSEFRTPLPAGNLGPAVIAFDFEETAQVGSGLGHELPSRPAAFCPCNFFLLLPGGW